MIKLDDLRGKYVLAVSGGVDSMVLLDVLAGQPSLELVIAHFDHGIRPESAADAEFVSKKAQDYKLSFYLSHGKLGHNASEDVARKARYKFLNDVKLQTNSVAIITAHHQDDLVETAIINVLRGTGPAGLAAMLNNRQIVRPLLKFNKAEILEYAKRNNIDWVEDKTNDDPKYLRNYVRKYVAGELSEQQKQKILANIYKTQKLSRDIDELNKLVAKDVLESPTVLKRSAFTSLPSDVGNEFIYSWLKQSVVADLDRKSIERLALAIRTAKPFSAVDIKNGAKLEFTVKNAQIRTP